MSAAGSGGGGGAGYASGGGGGSGVDCYYSGSLTFHSGGGAGGGGGGGSSFVAATATSPSITGGHSGSGSVVIVYTLPASPNLVLNPGFDKINFVQPVRTLTAPGSDGAWQVTQGSVDVVNSSYWQPGAGLHSLDLAGTGPGTISQTVNLPYADSYRISFKLAGNPDCGPVVKKLGIYWNGGLVATRTFNISGHTRAAMGWAQRSLVVNGLPGPGTLGFASLNTGGCGPVLDSVALRYR